MSVLGENMTFVLRNIGTNSGSAKFYDEQYVKKLLT